MTDTWNEYKYFDIKNGQEVPDNRFANSDVKLMVRPVGRWRLATPDEQAGYIRDLMEEAEDEDYD